MARARLAAVIQERSVPCRERIMAQGNGWSMHSSTSSMSLCALVNDIHMYINDSMATWCAYLGSSSMLQGIRNNILVDSRGILHLRVQ